MVSNEDNYSKTKDKQMLADAVKKYLKKGGKIEQCPEGAITDEGQMNYKFRKKSSPKSK